MEKEANEVLERLEESGFQAYKVGGYVRDRLLGGVVHDIDIATSATPDQVMNLFAHVIPTGLKHGTVTLKWKDYWFEVTTFRVESDYLDHRHPGKVEYVTDIELDLSRRDFTINAMAMDRWDRIVDPYGGRRDLAQRILRAVGNPHRRFEEDALRILRAIRFSAGFHLEIEEDTWEAMKLGGKWVRSISMERIRDEIEKMVESKQPVRAIELLSASSLLPIEGWNRLFTSYAAWSYKQRIEELHDVYMRWALLLAVANYSAKQAGSFLTEWRFSKKFIGSVTTILNIYEAPIEREVDGKKLLITYDWKTIKKGLTLKHWLSRDASILDEKLWKRWEEELPIRKQKELAVTGRDIIDGLHRDAGPWLGELLELLFNKVILGQIPNQRADLLKEARKVMETNERTNTKNL